MMGRQHGATRPSPSRSEANCVAVFNTQKHWSTLIAYFITLDVFVRFKQRFKIQAASKMTLIRLLGEGYTVLGYKNSFHGVGNLPRRLPEK